MNNLVINGVDYNEELNLLLEYIKIQNYRFVLGFSVIDVCCMLGDCGFLMCSTFDEYKSYCKKVKEERMISTPLKGENPLFFYNRPGLICDNPVDGISIYKQHK